YIPPSNFYVEPYLIVVQKKIVLNPNNDEVIKVHSFTLKKLFANENVSTYAVQAPNGEMHHAPCFIIDTTIIWGATAMIISELKQWCIAQKMLI
ncbi:MAG: coenzyme A pyrophosphatase, partial [Bacteroidia bacterium]|nr:coenzyme A pyrophosphatase [Bacteroidia bacterium]